MRRPELFLEVLGSDLIERTGGDFGPLEDRSYFLTLDEPYETTLVAPFYMNEG